MRAKISGTGSYLPKTIMTNHDLAQKLETSDEWIRQRVGIISRHIASGEETNTFMATEAAKKALTAAKVSAEQIDLIIVATSTSELIMPSMATQVQGALGIQHHCMAFDISAACTGFVYALGIANQFFNSGAVKHAIVIGAERMSRVLNWEDRATCVLFGDGAGAVVLSASDEPGIIATRMHSDGVNKELLFIPNNLATQPFSALVPEAHLMMEGNKVFKHAVNMLEEVVDQILVDSGFSKTDVDWLVPHQANERIITATAKKLDMPMTKVVLTLSHHGNTSAASVPLALDAAVKDGRIKRGDLLLLEAFGAGFVWGAALVRY